MKIRKILTGLAATCLVCATLSVAVSAVEPSYKVSDDYKDTLYYDNLQAIELTGDGATDVIAVALSQLYYHEGNNDAEKDGLNNSGSRNFVEYNVLFGKLDNGEGNGTSYGYAWCAAFVNWCLRQARVDKALTGGMYVSCHSWRNWFIKEGADFGASYHDRTDDYIPRKGDLIFYRSLTATHSRATDHIGIVLKCENGVVHAIEGNGDNRVALHEYALDNSYIVGYGSIAYKTADVPEVDYFRKEDHMPGFFIAGNGVIPAYSGPDSSTGRVTSLTAKAVYRIAVVEGDYGRITMEDGTDVWVSLKRFTPITTDEFVTVEMILGEQSYRARVAKGESWSLPATELWTAVFGEIPNFSFWGGNGVSLSEGQSFIPEADVTLHAVVEEPTQAPTTEQTETETETEIEPETEAVTETAAETATEAVIETITEPVTEQVPAQTEQQSTESVVESHTEQVTAQIDEEKPEDQGCSGALGTAVLVILMAAGFALSVRKKSHS